MTPGVQRLAWLAGFACVGALAFAVTYWRGGSDAMPQQASVPEPSLPVSPAPAPALEAASAATAAASVPTVSMSASAVLPLPPVDISRMQRDIQLAISSDQRGKAGEAAKHIQTCLMAERSAEQQRQRLATTADEHRIPEPFARFFRAHQDQLLAACQAVDAASRAQLVPLLRRSFAEGDKGAAAGLVQALGKNFNLADEPGVVPALRRDAWDCDRSSQGVLSSLARRDPQLLTPNEIGALRDQQRIQAGQGLEAALRKEGDSKRKAILEQLMASFQPPPETDPTEVARISADIQSHCEAARADVPGGTRPGVPT